MEIKLYEDRYRDDMIFMVLQAKDALGRIPSINEDLLDIKKNYFDRGDMFWIAADDNDRVIGCGGYSRIEGTNEAFIHRLYIKASKKHKGGAWISPVPVPGKRTGLLIHQAGLQAHIKSVNLGAAPCSQCSQGSAAR